MKQKRTGLHVVSSSGRRQRFLRGMMTHDLLLRGVDFDTAYATAQEVRDRLHDREEVETAELHRLIAEVLETEHQLSLPQAVLHRRPSGLTVLVEDQSQPFSRGLLARSVQAGGLDLDAAYEIVDSLELQLRSEGLNEIRSADIVSRIGSLLQQVHGLEAARRYRRARRLSRLQKPLIVDIGGATGTGKSTVSVELAPLLRIFRINATDTIRQVMRMVFSQQILPSIHNSSYELQPPAEPDSAVVDGPTFEEQAATVAVGVRAVVERAIAEGMSIIVEGVHLYPPMVPFPDLDGLAHQVPLMLGTLDNEVHRARLSLRGRVGHRKSRRYMRHFESIRGIHDFLLQQADAYDVPLIDTSVGDPPVGRVMRVVSRLLANHVQGLDGTSDAPRAPAMLVIIDGLADRPVRALGGRTPLQAAATPVLDRLAKEGRCGMADPIAPGVVADTAAGTLALFGQSPLAMSRGPIEALGAGIELEPGDIALRGNLATLDERGQVVDRRAGRIRDQANTLAKALDRMKLPGEIPDSVEVIVKAATEHRLAIVIRGAGLSSAIRGSDPGEGATPGAAQVPAPLDPDDEAAVHTSRILAVFEAEARRILGRHKVNKRRVAEGLPAANTVLTRGAGHAHKLLPLEHRGLPLQITCVAGDCTILGLAGLMKAKLIHHGSMTASLDTDLDAKFVAARKALEQNELVVVHLKGGDIAAHDQRPDLKTEFLERVDIALGHFLETLDGPIRIAVGADHATLSESGQHASDPIPVLIWGQGIEADEAEIYDETAVAAGSLGRFPLQMLLHRLFELD